MHNRISRHKISMPSRVFGAGQAHSDPDAGQSTRRPIFRERRSSPITGRRLCVASLALLTSVVLSACTHAAAPVPTVDPHATATATPIPPVLAAYVQAVRPLLQMSTAEGKSLLTKMQHDDLSVVGDECSTFGGDFQSAQATIRGTYTPHPATRVYVHAHNGYRLLAVSTDECGLASDTNSKSEMKSAVADLKSGLAELNMAYNLTKPWVPVS